MLGASQDSNVISYYKNSMIATCIMATEYSN